MLAAIEPLVRRAPTRKPFLMDKGDRAKHIEYKGSGPDSVVYRIGTLAFHGYETASLEDIYRYAIITNRLAATIGTTQLNDTVSVCVNPVLAIGIRRFKGLESRLFSTAKMRTYSLAKFIEGDRLMKLRDLRLYGRAPTEYLSSDQVIIDVTNTLANAGYAAHPGANNVKVVRDGARTNLVVTDLTMHMSDEYDSFRRHVPHALLH